MMLHREEKNDRRKPRKRRKIEKERRKINLPNE